jgi:hypothetical protein
MERRPDIALFSQGAKVFTVIEIVDTHAPDEEAIKFYLEKKIAIIQIKLDSEDDLEIIDDKISNPSSVDYCFNPKCANFENYVSWRKFVGEPIGCSSCWGTRINCYIRTTHFFGEQISCEFNEKEIEFAKSKGVEFDNGKVVCLGCKMMRSRYRKFRRL